MENLFEKLNADESPEKVDVPRSANEDDVKAEKVCRSLFLLWLYFYYDFDLIEVTWLCLQKLCLRGFLNDDFLNLGVKCSMYLAFVKYIFLFHKLQKVILPQLYFVKVKKFVIHYFYFGVIEVTWLCLQKFCSRGFLNDNFLNLGVKCSMYLAFIKYLFCFISCTK